MEHLPSWDLSTLFKTQEDCVKAIIVLQKSVKQFADQYKDKITTSEILLKAVHSYENIVDGMHRVGTFAYLSYITHMNEHERKALYQKASDALAVFSSELAFFALEINELPDEIIFNETLKKYKTFFENIRIFKPYELPEKIEQVLIKKSITSSGAWSKFFDETMSRLRFDFEGQKMTSAQIFDLLCHEEAGQREKAGHIIAQTLKENIHTFTFITNTLAKDKQLDDEMRGFREPISSRNISNLIEDNIVHSLLSSVKKSYQNTSHKYYKLKAKILGKDKLEYWDRNAPMPFHSNIK
jgi:oligoendopeptidase F